jgi:hypothetical protein
LDSITWSHEYAEPGYTNPAKGILFGDWNYFSNDVHRLLEQYGYELEWEDEWSTCSDCGKALRTSPDSYGWQPSYFIMHECELLCKDCCPMEEYLEGLEDNPRQALNDHIDPSDYGYVKLEGDFENGFYGRSDNPTAIYKRLHDAGHKRLLFNIDGVGQFDTTFSIWEKVTESDQSLESAQ